MFSEQDCMEMYLDARGWLVGPNEARKVQGLEELMELYRVTEVNTLSKDPEMQMEDGSYLNVGSDIFEADIGKTSGVELKRLIGYTCKECGSTYRGPPKISGGIGFGDYTLSCHGCDKGMFRDQRTLCTSGGFGS